MIELEIYNAIHNVTTTVLVEELEPNKFRMVDNDIADYRLTKGTEFEITMNQKGVNEVLRITKISDFITRQFVISPKYKESDYLMLADELTKLGGFWQLDLDGIATINIPHDFKYDIDQIMIELNLELTEIKNDDNE